MFLKSISVVQRTKNTSGPLFCIEIKNVFYARQKRMTVLGPHIYLNVWRCPLIFKCMCVCVCVCIYMYEENVCLWLMRKGVNKKTMQL